MYFDQPKPPFGPYNPDGYTNNPGSSVPGPWPSLSNTAWWSGERTAIVWTPQPLPIAVNNPVYWRAQWQSPLFDLRPELRGSGQGIANGVPIWKAGYQAGTKLWAQVTGLNKGTDGPPRQAAIEALRVTAQAFAHVNNAQLVVATDPPVDITRDLTHNGGVDSRILQFYPTGDGYPIRYWRVVLTFEKIKNLNPSLAALELAVQGSFY
jgi:hypothetical protein